MSDKTHGERISSLEVAVQRIEARVMEGRPTPPGVFPPMGGASCSCASLRARGQNAYCSRCPPTPAEAAIFERGGYVPDDAGRAAFRKATEERMADLTRRIFEADRRQTCEARPSTPIAGLDAMLPPLAPAAMLGEAVKMAQRAESIAFDVYHATLAAGAPDGIPSARVLLIEAVSALKRAQRESEARLVSCPRGIHGAPGADACDCAAIAKTEAER